MENTAYKDQSLRGWKERRCPKCGGSGVWVVPYRIGTLRRITDPSVGASRDKCPDCWGRGVQFLPPTDQQKGSGQ